MHTFAMQVGRMKMENNRGPHLLTHRCENYEGGAIQQKSTTEMQLGTKRGWLSRVYIFLPVML
jgi:hypothetical protein